MANIALATGVFIFSFIMGYVLILKIPSLLHTPLMSMTNAISAVTILGCLVLFSVESSPFELIVGAIALMMASFNLVGGFTITGRMLRMFKNKNTGRAKQ
ncbi:MAG: NAD(P) transhydrogenase subunit alpha [Proteobacteria bacterium]|nr:NAD(P) transhydrogenase subunit alpha [Pseudomonadota bacterium]